MGNDDLVVESAIAAPDLTCPKCNGLLPNGLGELTCVLCDAEVKVDHQPTIRAWEQEKLACPECHSVLLAGVGHRPANLRCSSCDCEFILTQNVPKAEVRCPSCQRGLRMKKWPGSREVTCPACEGEFKVTF